MVRMKAVMHNPKLADTWLINGYQTGKGRLYGKMTVEATAAPDEFTTKSSCTTPLAKSNTNWKGNRLYRL